MNDLNCWELKFELCCYSERLLKKLSEINDRSLFKNQVNLYEIKKAIYYTKKYHGNQKRESGDPYYTHPLEVAYMISDYDYGFKTNILVTSILHDILEDTVMTKIMLSTIFGFEVANQVEDLTRIKDSNKISSTELVNLLFNQKKRNILFIKLFDRLHNMQTIFAKRPEKIKTITNETIETFIMLALYLEIFPIEIQLKNLCLQAISIKNYDVEYEDFLFNDTFQLPFPIFQNELSPY